MTKQPNVPTLKTPITRVLASVSFFAFLSRYIRFQRSRLTKTIN